MKTFGPSSLYYELKEHTRKMDDINNKGAGSEYFNEMYLYGGRSRFDFLDKPKKRRLKWLRKMFSWL